MDPLVDIQRLSETISLFAELVRWLKDPYVALSAFAIVAFGVIVFRDVLWSMRVSALEAQVRELRYWREAVSFSSQPAAQPSVVEDDPWDEDSELEWDPAAQAPPEEPGADAAAGVVDIGEGHLIRQRRSERPAARGSWRKPDTEQQTGPFAGRAEEGDPPDRT